MPTLNDLEKRLAEIAKMDYPDTCYYDVPPEIAVQEAYDLYHWCKHDEALFLEDENRNYYLSELLPRADCLREAQSRWQDEKKFRTDFVKSASVRIEEGFKLKRQLEHEFRYLLKEDPVAILKVRKWSRQNSRADLVQSLMNYAVMGKDAKGLKENREFDYSLLNKAEKMADELGKLIGKLLANYGDSRDDAIMLRNKASWHLKEAVDVIRRYGRWKFYNDHEKYQGYISAWLREHKNKSGGRKGES